MTANSGGFIRKKFLFQRRSKIKMAFLRFSLCLVLVFSSMFLGSGSRPLLATSSQSNAMDNSDSPTLNAEGTVLLVSGLKAMRKPNRLSPGGPDPKHH
ncbi:hypothetical protein L6164_036793 [Bauhinia variegata]|uniref:Uncharacterized protein n=1 Tax=Bauhinia variegata TaxID=167791 RepID=A0ACB9KI23_BAUVA|nr:hypothetical protein L6164_036793 [Bauhinia variegata]